jgi:hypothetical protein
MFFGRRRYAHIPVNVTRERPAGALCVVAGVLAAIGTALPFNKTTLGGTLVISRNAYQLGANLSMNATGPILMILAIAMFASGLGYLGFFQFRVHPVQQLIVAAIVVFDTIFAVTGGRVHVTGESYSYSYGIGGGITLLGGLLFALAGAMLLHDAPRAPTAIIDPGSTPQYPGSSPI